MKSVKHDLPRGRAEWPGVCELYGSGAPATIQYPAGQTVPSGALNCRVQTRQISLEWARTLRLRIWEPSNDYLIQFEGFAEEFHSGNKSEFWGAN